MTQDRDLPPQGDGSEPALSGWRSIYDDAPLTYEAMIREGGGYRVVTMTREEAMGKYPGAPLPDPPQ